MKRAADTDDDELITVVLPRGQADLLRGLARDLQAAGRAGRWLKRIGIFLAAMLGLAGSMLAVWSQMKGMR
jgi:hypothetical protein